jgi:type III restriction enzyme
MPQVVIENPVINSPFLEPQRHYKFCDEGITNEIVPSRRTSQYFIPIAQPRKKGQFKFETEWTADRVEENKFINYIRGRVAEWRKGGYQHITKATRRLLEYWTNPKRERKLFFCQIEALETAIYITEVAHRVADHQIAEQIRQANSDANPGLFRVAFKMATGSGKTVVMAMLIAWQTLNKLDNPQDARFTDTFLIVTPGITIRDRLRVLLPNDPGNYYQERDLLHPEEMANLGRAKILITNFHAFLLRERGEASKLTKELLAPAGNGAFKETPEQMVGRVCRALGSKKNIIVINDEAHHCYRHRVKDAQEEKLTGDDRKEAEKREEAARVWVSGIEAIQAKIGVKAVYDLSATPFFLRGSGYPEGTLFTWVVSDFSLIDAIEAGIVKVPRVPIADDSMTGDQPTYRDLWYRIRDDLPKKGRGTEKLTGEPKLPPQLEGALHSLYSNYEQYLRQWEENGEAQAKGLTPPVFIVVCNNTNVSKLVFDYIAGWEKELPDGTTRVQAGKLTYFRNDDGQGGWLSLPTTILVDSEQLESGESMSAEFKKVVAHLIEDFKDEYRQRFPGRDPEALTDEDLLREVMNTVGKPGKLGQHVKCVVSVSMLSEGWDANTVTHILGIRAFGTQLLCEQVVGRGLRRMTYATETQRVKVRGEDLEFEGFPVEYAEVYGVPFSFIPCSGAGGGPKPGPMPTRVRALEERIGCEITFPRLTGYRFDIPTDRLKYEFTDECRLALSTQDVPSRTENAPIVGQSVIHTLDDLKARREQEVAFLLAKLTLEKYFRQDGETREGKTDEHRFDSEVQTWLFPQVLKITREWLGACVTCKDNAFPQLLLLMEYAHDASDRIYQAIVGSEEGQHRLLPILKPYDTIGSTQHVDFTTVKPTYSTNPLKCHISHVVADTGSWEQKMAQTLEDMPEVIHYVKNHNLGFYIPYTVSGEEHNYVPDFVVRYDDGHGEPLNLVVEVTGEKDKDKAAKVATATNLWVPAVNNHGGFGRWAFIEISDPWDAQRLIRKSQQ